jgi:hypothetical protein
MRSRSTSRTRQAALVTLLSLIALLALACADGDEERAPEPTASPEPTAATEAPRPGLPVLEGVFETGFEHSAFYPDVARPSGSTPYWVSWVPELDFAQRIIDETDQHPFAEPYVPPFRVRIRGDVSAPGRYGHLGQYPREVVVHEILSVAVARECDVFATSDLRLARERWEASGLVSYELRFERHCECSREWAGPIDVVVEQGVITSARFDGQPAGEDTAITIDELFDAIDDAVSSGVETRVSYDPERGYPVSVQLDLQALAVDGGLSLAVLELDPLE